MFVNNPPEAAKPTIQNKQALQVDNDQNIRTAFFISDGTAITAETLGHSLLAQFPHVEFDIHILPYITTEEAAMNVVEEITTFIAASSVVI